MMLEKIRNCMLIFLFFSLPLIHWELFSTFWIGTSFWVNGNFEFTKSQFFICISGVIFIITWLISIIEQKKIVFNTPLILSFWVLVLSTIFSISPLTALFWMESKWHGILMFGSLICIYFILLQIEKNFMKQLFFTSVAWWFFASIIAIKEFFYPSFDYGDLASRALGTFGHPNYLVLFLLLLIPFIFEKAKKHSFLYLLLIPIISVIFLTKSVWGVIIFSVFLLFVWSTKIACVIPMNAVWTKKIKRSYMIFFTLFIIVSIIYTVFEFWFLTKLHSFLSRFYIWESTMRIIVENPKIFFIGSWADTLTAYFSSYKSSELYIFENFGFIADRPHNLFLNILFHFWIAWVWVLVFLLYKLYKNYQNNYLYHSLIIFLAFTIFNFASVASYLLLVLILACISSQDKKVSYNFFITMVLLIFWSVWVYYSSLLYYSEVKVAKNQYALAINIFPYVANNYFAIWEPELWKKYLWYESSKYYISKIQKWENQPAACENFTNAQNSAESYFYCWSVFWNQNQKEWAQSYYMKGLAKMPNLWDNKSEYLQSSIIRESIDGIRFFSEKYSPLQEVLDRAGIENNFK